MGLLITLVEPDPESVRYTCVNPSWLQNIYLIPIFDIIFLIPWPNSSPIDINPFFPGQKQSNSIHFTPSRPSFKPRPHYAGEIWKRISTVRPMVHTNLSQKRSILKTLLKPEEFENSRFCFCGQKTFWKRSFSKTMSCKVTMLLIFPSLSFPQTQIQNDFWLLRFQISPA